MPLLLSGLLMHLCHDRCRIDSQSPAAGSATIATIATIAAMALCVAGCVQTRAAGTVPAADPGDEPAVADADDPAAARAALDGLADDYYAWLLARRPEIAYVAAVKSERHDTLFDNTPQALREAEREEDRFRARLVAIPADGLAGSPQWMTAAVLDATLAGAVALRACRQELWNVNHMGGWHLEYPRIAELQPVATAAERDQALVRWRAFAAFVAQEQANLAAGLAAGYSAPRSVVDRVLAQLDAQLALDLPEQPYASPARRSDDAAFSAAFSELVSNDVLPALERFREWLGGVYRDAARTTLSVTANPGGENCYEASLAAYTTLPLSGREIYDRGREVVAANRAAVARFGRERYGTDTFAATIAAVRADPADNFADARELLAFSKDAVDRAAASVPGWVGTVPVRPVEVVPLPPQEEGTGRSAYYMPGNRDRAAEYRIPLHAPENQSRGNAEATAFHETWPGHHLQVTTAQARGNLHPVNEILWFSGPGEGWARYAEALAEEMGLYETATGPILRRAWPAHGMVVDPGIHLFGWTREQAVNFIVETGRIPAEQGDGMVDRIAILPGQLTAYDAGGLEILALRREAEAALGQNFDLSTFHDRVLEAGTLPLGALRAHVETWIERTRAGAPPKSESAGASQP
ncbi:MAG TPA: DUF885 domain-containing protein [Woeseiaceae bacterium]|nr:DUF885 domain-containing protein [Woeseiaceae bacterium]